jgi:uncharacterized membrane protein (DUF4010 family)
MTVSDLAYRDLAVALAAGLLVGIERGWRQRDVRSGCAVAALLTLCFGTLARSGQPLLAMASAAIVTMILAMRGELHGLIKKLGEAAVIALTRIAVIAGAIWPLLPDERFGPYGAWNPHQLWLVVVFVTGLSFAGYAASRVFGVEKRILATAAIGGAVLANMLVKIGGVIVYAGFKRGHSAILALSAGAATLAGAGALTMVIR